MQKKTIDPLDALDRAYREVGPDAGADKALITADASHAEPLEVLRTLTSDQGAGEVAAPEGAEAPQPAAAQSRALTRPGGLPADPLEALRQLEQAIADPAVPEAGPTAASATRAPASDDPLLALQELEKQESNFWAEPQAETDEAPPAVLDEPPPATADAPERPEPLLSTLPPQVETPPEGATTEPPTPSPPPPVEAAAPTPLRALVMDAPARSAARESGSAARQGQRHAKTVTRLTLLGGRLREPRRRRSEPAEIAPAQDPGGTARAAFYRARQELGADASHDEIIKRACEGLDRDSQQILFEIQLKILLGQSV